MRNTVWLGVLACALGCNGDGTDDTDGTGLSVEQLCAGEGDATVTLGTGAGGLFEPLVDGAQVDLDVAPQGGFGVSVQVLTTGLKTEGDAVVQVDTEINGAVNGSFTFDPPLFLFCNDDGNGVLGQGVSVGFDPVLYTTDNLDELDGEQADLVVLITDDRGIVGEGRTTVEVKLGAR